MIRRSIQLQIHPVCFILLLYFTLFFSSANGTFVNKIKIGKGLSVTLSHEDFIDLLPSKQADSICFTFYAPDSQIPAIKNDSTQVLDVDETIALSCVELPSKRMKMTPEEVEVNLAPNQPSVIQKDVPPVSQHLTCPICCLVMVECISFSPCSHKTCGACALDLFVHSARNAWNAEAKCPSCRSQVTGAQRDFTINSIVGDLMKAEGIPDDQRPSEAEVTDMTNKGREVSETIEKNNNEFELKCFRKDFSSSNEEDSDDEEDEDNDADDFDYEEEDDQDIPFDSERNYFSVTHYQFAYTQKRHTKVMFNDEFLWSNIGDARLDFSSDCFSICREQDDFESLANSIRSYTHPFVNDNMPLIVLPEEETSGRHKLLSFLINDSEHLLEYLPKSLKDFRDRFCGGVLDIVTLLKHALFALGNPTEEDICFGEIAAQISVPFTLGQLRQMKRDATGTSAADCDIYNQEFDDNRVIRMKPSFCLCDHAEFSTYCSTDCERNPNHSNDIIIHCCATDSTTNIIKMCKTLDQYRQEHKTFLKIQTVWQGGANSNHITNIDPFYDCACCGNAQSRADTHARDRLLFEAINGAQSLGTVVSMSEVSLYKEAFKIDSYNAWDIAELQNVITQATLNSCLFPTANRLPISDDKDDDEDNINLKRETIESLLGDSDLFCLLSIFKQQALKLLEKFKKSRNEHKLDANSFCNVPLDVPFTNYTTASRNFGFLVSAHPNIRLNSELDSVEAWKNYRMIRTEGLINLKRLFPVNDQDNEQVNFWSDEEFSKYNDPEMLIENYISLNDVLNKRAFAGFDDKMFAKIPVYVNGETHLEAKSLTYGYHNYAIPLGKVDKQSKEVVLMEEADILGIDICSECSVQLMKSAAPAWFYEENKTQRTLCWWGKLCRTQNDGRKDHAQRLSHMAPKTHR